MLSPDERFEAALEGVEARLVVAGHTHMQFKRGRWVNAGSIGMPYEDDVAAFWALVSDDVEFRRTPFDVERVASEILASGWPEAESFVAENIRTLLLRARKRPPIFESLRVRVQVGRVGKPHGLAGRVLRRARKRGPGALRGRSDAARRREARRSRRVEARRRPAGDPARPRGRARRRDRGRAERSSRSPKRASTTPSSSSASRCRRREARSSGGSSRSRPNPANDVLELDTGLALPLVDACVQEVDLAAGRILVQPGFAPDS